MKRTTNKWINHLALTFFNWKGWGWGWGGIQRQRERERERKREGGRERENEEGGGCRPGQNKCKRVSWWEPVQSTAWDEQCDLQKKRQAHTYSTQTMPALSTNISWPWSLLFCSEDKPTPVTIISWGVVMIIFHTAVQRQGERERKRKRSAKKKENVSMYACMGTRACVCELVCVLK